MELLCLYKRGLFYAQGLNYFRTKNWVNAFIELLEESSLEQISITDITSRPTFYYYYSQIKEDLLKNNLQRF